MQRMPGPRGFLTDQEKENLPKVSWNLIKRILGYLTPYWVKFLMVFATILLSSVLGLLPSIILPAASWMRRWWGGIWRC